MLAASYHVAGNTTGIDAAASLARLVMATSVAGILAGFCICFVFGVWMNQRFRRVEQCLNQCREELRKHRSPKPEP